MPGKSRLPLLALSLVVWVAPPASGQVPLTAAQSEKVEPYFGLEDSAPPLDCSIQPRKPYLDFAFRFSVGYILSCPLRAFGGRETTIWAFTRVSPEGGKPLILGQAYRLPGLSPEQALAIDNTKLKGRTETSGGFCVGEGRYRVDLLLVDGETGRGTKKRWEVRAARRRSERAVAVAVPPATVMPLVFRPWAGKLDASGKGLRLTVWLDAAPMNPRAHKLRAWDQALLLGSLSSLLSQIPCASVRLTAFNLAQQREIFRRDEFDEAGFIELAEALRDLELGTVSYRVLERRHGALAMLADLANRELTSADPSDAVIILGPHTFHRDPVPRGMLKARETPRPYFCYFQYFPWTFWLGMPLENTLQSLTERLDGNLYRIQSPGELARATQKMLARVQSNGSR